MRSMAPGQSVKAATVDQSLVLTGTVADAEQAANIVQVANQFVDDPTRVVNRLSVAAPTQVNLQVRIAEVARNVDRQLGIQWNDVSVGINGGSIGFRGGGRCRATTRRRYGATRGSFNIDVVLQALQEEGLVTIMAEPNLTARSGEPATFLAGGEYPYSTVSDNGTNVQFKNFGIGLNFTPTVIDGNRISLTVGTEVSELDFAQSATVPSLRTRRAETTVDLASGQSFAIAGLMENSSSQNSSRVPALGTMPVIGALFRSPGVQARAERARHHRDAGDRQPDHGPADLDAGRQLRAAERLRAHPARPLPGQSARAGGGAEHASASAASPARPASCSSEGHVDANPHSPSRQRAGPRLASWRSPPARSSRSARSRTPRSSPPAAARKQSVYFQPGSAALRARRGGTAALLPRRRSSSRRRPTSCCTSAAPARRCSTRGAAARSAPASRGRRRGCG